MTPRIGGWYALAMALLLSQGTARADFAYSYTIFHAPDDWSVNQSGTVTPHTTVITGINDAGNVAGYFYSLVYYNSFDSGYHGFEIIGGTYRRLDAPDSRCWFPDRYGRLQSSTTTRAYGIDNAGNVTGSYSTPLPDGVVTSYRGFSYDGHTYTTLSPVPSSPRGRNITLSDAPFAGYSYTVYGENAYGQLVGSYSKYGTNYAMPGQPGYDDTIGTFGFIATPLAVPEPSAFVSASIMIAMGLGLWGWNRRGLFA
jgi:hypothetical protein